MKVSGQHAAALWLRGVLSSGAMSSRDIQRWAINAGFTEKNLRTARELLRVSVSRVGRREEARSFWSLPDEAKAQAAARLAQVLKAVVVLRAEESHAQSATTTAHRYSAAAMLPLLQDWAERQAALEKQMQALAAIFGDGADCALGIAVWNAWNAYTNTLSALIGDHEFWLTWFEAENEMGRKALTITSTGGRVRRIRTLRQLARVIEECAQ